MIKLTVDKILQLQAGLKLNTLIAEQIMGWTLVDNCGWEWQGRILNTGAWEWNPSDNIGNAWEVVQHLNWLWFKVGRENCNGIRYDASCYNTLHAKPKFHVTAKTAPLAICHVALLATLDTKKNK